VGGWFDGVVEASGDNCGAGGFIKINEHRCYKWFFNIGPGTNTKAELLGAWALLLLASRLSILEIYIRGDSKIIIDWLKGMGHLQVVALECWKDRIKEITKHFQKITYEHVYREGNTVADSLSKRALQQVPGKIIYYMCEEGHEGPLQFLNLY
jgi:ribonuclease HI